MATVIFEKSRALSEFIVLPGYVPKDYSPGRIELSVPLTKYKEGEEPKIKLNAPFLSAAMQSVTGPEMAVAMARCGGLGVIYCSQTAQEQAEMIRKVKNFKAGFVEPETVGPGMLITQVTRLSEERGYHTFPVTDERGRFLGIIKRNDYNIDKHGHMSVKERMINADKIYFAYYDDVEDDLKKAHDLLTESHSSVLPILDRDGTLRYLVFRKDIDENLDNPNELVDGRKRYIVGAAVNTHDYESRAPLLAEAGADIFFIDTSQGFNDYLAETIQYLKNKYPDIPVVGGNIVTGDGFNFMVQNGADAVKVGMGSGSICITQEQIGVGLGQATAIMNVAEMRDKYCRETEIYVPIISDGGVMISKDILVSIALGADAVMMGKYFAGCDESPTEVQERMVTDEKGRRIMMKVKPYWGEGSSKAKQWMLKRYDHAIFEEGIEDYVFYQGLLKKHFSSALAQLKDGIRKSGSRNIQGLHKNANVQIISQMSLKEGKPHGLVEHQ
jgi:IMP dehydrogenase